MTEPNYARMTPDEIEELAWGDERELFQIWRLYVSRERWHAAALDMLWHEATAGSAKGSAEASSAKIQEILDQMPDCTPLQALRANKRLVDLLTVRRLAVIDAAVEDGATWDDIGRAMNMTEERAREWYDKVSAGEEIAPGLDVAAIERIMRDFGNMEDLDD
jgi:hypothetical protein